MIQQHDTTAKAGMNHRPSLLKKTKKIETTDNYQKFTRNE